MWRTGVLMKGVIIFWAVIFVASLGTVATAQEEEATENGLKAFETVGKFLEEDEWYPYRIEDRYIYKMTFAGDHGDTNCYAQVRTDLEQFLFYVVAPVKAEEAKRQAMAEYLTRANYGLRIGNFEMDFNDGEIRYKSSLDFEDVELSYPLIKRAIYPAVQTMDRYLPGIFTVIASDTPPAEVIDEIEGR